MTFDDDHEPTVEEVKEMLRGMGMPVDGWGEVQSGTVQSPFVERQREMLIKVRDLLQMQIQRDFETVGELQEKVDRLKHGGGK
jgi:hypothetical protein